MQRQHLSKNYKEAIREISENRSTMTEGRRNELTLFVLEREVEKTRTQMKKPFKLSIDDSFLTIISMVENGWDISKALARLRIDKGLFYRTISKEQKCLLDMAKTVNTKFGIGSRDGQ